MAVYVNANTKVNVSHETGSQTPRKIQSQPNFHSLGLEEYKISIHPWVAVGLFHRVGNA